MNLILRHKSLLLKWINRVKDNGEFAYCYHFLNPDLRELIWAANLSPRDIPGLFVESYWREVLFEWAKETYVDASRVTGYDILEQMLWYNSNILVRAKPVFYRKWYEAGIVYIMHIVKDGRLYTCVEIQNEYGIDVETMQYNQLISAIPHCWKRKLKEDNNVDLKDDDVLQLSDVCSTKKPSQYIYNTLVKRGRDNVHHYYLQWINKGITDEQIYRQALSAIYKVTYVTKLRDFQYRYLLRKLYANKTLHKWGIKESAQCEWCTSEQDYMHLFWSCPSVQALWDHIYDHARCLNQAVKLSYENISTGLICTPAKNVWNLVILMVKQYIYRKKCQNEKPSIRGVEWEIERMEKLMRYNSRIRSSLRKHMLFWKDFFPEVEEIVDLERMDGACCDDKNSEQGITPPCLPGWVERSLGYPLPRSAKVK